MDRIGLSISEFDSNIEWKISCQTWQTILKNISEYHFRTRPALK